MNRFYTNMLQKRISALVVAFFIIFTIPVLLSAKKLNLNTLTKNAAPEVIKCVEDKLGLDEDYRAQCVDILARWKEKSGKSAISSVLQNKGNATDGEYDPRYDKHSKVRIAACYALGSFGENDVIPVLISSLKEDKHYAVRVAAAYVLQTFKEESAVDGLIDGLLLEIQKDKNASFPVVRQIIRSLGVIGNKKAFIPLLKATQVSFPNDIKEDAQESIEKITW